METTEIQERNKQIALMLGKKYKNNSIVIHYDNVCGVNPTGATWQVCLYHSDWNWLMEAIEFIEKLGYESLLGSSEYYYPEKGMRHIQHFIKDDLTIYHESKDKKEAVFIAVSDFAKLYNEKKL